MSPSRRPRSERPTQRRPIRVVPLRPAGDLAPSAGRVLPPPAALLTYRGGPLLTAVEVVDALTSVCSHELAEAITDPVPGEGWYDDTSGEIGDICAWQNKRLGAYEVQLLWSNRARACV